MPPKKLSGTEMTSAHGQEMTRNVSARRNHSVQFPNASDGNTKSAAAPPTTAGV